MPSPDAKSLPPQGTKAVVQLGLRANRRQFTLLHGFGWWALTMGLLGLGTALVYPTLLAAVADVAHPDWRASAVGVYRLWRDSGYAIGALLAGLLADLFGVTWAIGVIAGVTFLSGVIVYGVMRETLLRKRVVKTPTM